MRSQRKDPLAYRPTRTAAAPARPARPTRTSAAAAPRRRNRKRIPPVVLWNRRFRSLRNSLLVTLFVEIIWLCLTSPLLVVQKVTVSGAQVRTPRQITQLAGLTKRINIFRARTGKATRALARLPEVESVRIERRLPRTLAVIIKERAALANVMVGKDCWVIDPHGLVFRKVDAPLKDRPVLYAAVTGPVATGKPLPITALTPALQCLAKLPDLPLARNAGFHIDATNDVWMGEPNGLKIRLGQLDDAPGRMELTARLLKGPNGRDLMTKAAVLDVTSPQNEVYKPRGNTDDYRVVDVKDQTP